MILLVDDDPGFLLEAEATLGRNEQVYFAANAEAARALMRSMGRAFSVVLIDLNLPGMNGFELIREMRQQFPDLPIVAISGVVSNAPLEGTRALGADETLRKPVTPQWSEVLDRVRKTGASN
jgi:CheY-like chemotaxis protein